MTHQHLPRTYSLPRTPAPSTTPPPVADGERLSRAVARVGTDFPAVGVLLYAAVVSS